MALVKKTFDSYVNKNETECDSYSVYPEVKVKMNVFH